MSTFSSTHTWITGDVITAALLNGQVASFVAAGNAVNQANVDATGFYASQIKPTSGAQGTFGGTQVYTFPSNLVLSASATTSATSVALWNDNGATNGLVLNVPTGSTNGFQFMVNGVQVAQVETGGEFVSAGASFSAEIDFTGTTVSAAEVAIGGDAGGTKGLLINVPTGSTNGIQGQVNGVTKLQLGAAGDFQVAPLINAISTLSRVGPVYTVAGAALGATYHEVSGSVTFAANASQTVTLTNNAVFTSGTSYLVLLEWDSTTIIGNGNILAVNSKTATTFIITSITLSGIATNVTGTVRFLAKGT